MSKRQKRAKIFQTIKGDAHLYFIQKILEDHGYSLSHISGSHFHFTKQNAPSITIPAHNNLVKKWYIKELQKMLKNTSANG